MKEVNYSPLVKTPFEKLTNHEIVAGPILTPEMQKELFGKVEELLSMYPITFVMVGIFRKREMHLWYNQVMGATIPYIGPGIDAKTLVREIHVGLDATRPETTNLVKTSWGIYEVNQTSSHKIVVSWHESLHEAMNRCRR